MIDKSAPLPKFLVNRYKKWISGPYLTKATKLKKLVSNGQKPSSMIISCCDSRVHATSIFGADVGEFFIHRNIANLIPPYKPDNENHGTSAAIEYATKELKIKYLIIMGHTDCGGIKSGHNLYSNKYNKDYEFINKWLSILQPAYNKIKKNTSEKNQIYKLGEESIKVSICNLLTFPYIKKSVENKTLSIHGLMHNIGSGELKFLNPITENFENI